MYERGMYERGTYERGAQGPGAVALPVLERRAGERRRGLRRRGSGPRPVRPAVSAVAVRPAQVERPQAPSGARRVPLPAPGVRPLARRPHAVPRGAVLFARVRGVLAGAVVAVAAAAVVFGLGVLADSTAAVRAAEEAVRALGGTVVVTVGAERTPAEVARRLAPAASGSELTALAERIVTDNSLGSVPLRPGQVLRVTTG